MTTRILFAGGGTAGHAEPALATADALARRHPDWTMHFIGTRSGVEARLVPARGYELTMIERVPLPRRFSMDLLRLPGRMIQAIRQASEQVRRASAVVGFGGYVSAPAYLAARWYRIPIVIHEQNARSGIANRLGARWARYTASTFPQSGLRSAETIGLPLRTSIAALAHDVERDAEGTRRQARSLLGLDPDIPVLLVTGGSQGSARINAALAQIAQALVHDGWQILHSVGERNPLPAPFTGYHPVSYIDRMDLALAAAELMIGRSGAGTVAEAAALGVPAIFIPLPIGNGEQELNARASVSVGGAVVISDADCDGDRLRSTIGSLNSELKSMRARLTGIARLDAAERLAMSVERIVLRGSADD